MEDLTRRQFRNIEFFVSITDISVTSDHLVVDDCDQSLDTEDVVAKDEALNHVHLSTTDLIVTVLFIPDTILIEPIVGFGLLIERIAEVGRARGGYPVHRPVGQSKIVNQLLVPALIVLLHDAEVALRTRYIKLMIDVIYNSLIEALSDLPTRALLTEFMPNRRLEVVLFNILLYGQKLLIINIKQFSFL